MKPFIKIAFPSGHVFEVASRVVADDRTAYYALLDPNRTREQHDSETLNLFADDFQVFDWMKGNMDWSDLEPHARLVAFNPPDFKAAWDDAELKSGDSADEVDVTALGERAMLAPIELALRTAASAQQRAMVLGFSNNGTRVSSALVALIGGPEIVEGYIGAIAQYDQFMQSQPGVQHSH